MPLNGAPKLWSNSIRMFNQRRKSQNNRSLPNSKVFKRNKEEAEKTQPAKMLIRENQDSRISCRTKRYQAQNCCTAVIKWMNLRSFNWTMGKIMIIRECSHLTLKESSSNHVSMNHSSHFNRRASLRASLALIMMNNTREIRNSWSRMKGRDLSCSRPNQIDSKSNRSS